MKKQQGKNKDKGKEQPKGEDEKDDSEGKKEKKKGKKPKQFANDPKLDGDGDGKPKWADPDDPANKSKKDEEKIVNEVMRRVARRIMNMKKGRK